jgi:outer membrane protein assembly factor BamB
MRVRASAGAILLLSMLAAHARPIWQDTVPTAVDGQANAVVAGDGRVFAGGFVVSTATGNEDLLIRAYAQENGRVLWEDRVVDPARSSDVGSLALDGGRLFATALAFDPNGSVWAVRSDDAASGGLLWQDAADAGQTADVAAASGRTFAAGALGAIGGGSGGSFAVRAYDAASGVVLWEDRASGSGSADVAFAVRVAGDRVIAAGRSRNALAVCAYDAASGALIWTDDAAGFASRVQLAVAGGRAFVASETDRVATLRAYDASSGDALWQVTLPADPDGRQIVELGLAASDASAFLGRALGVADAALFAFAAPSGTPLWQRGDTGVARSLQVSGGRLFAASGAPELLARAFATDTGADAWSSGAQPDASALALAVDGPLALVAGVAGPRFGSFHLAAYGTATTRLLTPIRRGPRLPINR